MLLFSERESPDVKRSFGEGFVFHRRHRSYLNARIYRGSFTHMVVLGFSLYLQFTDCVLFVFLLYVALLKTLEIFEHL